MQKIALYILFFFLSTSVFSQMDTLKNVAFPKIMGLIYEQRDSAVSISISKYLTKEARLQNDSAAVSWGHYGNYLYQKHPSNIKYLDSLIIATKGLKNEEELFAITTNGDYFYSVNNFNKALSFYLETRKLSIELNNRLYIEYTTSALADIKFLAGEFSESLLLYHQYKKMGTEDNLSIYFNIANCHYELNNIDSLSYYSRLGIIKSLNENDTINYEAFLRLNGVSNFKQGNLKRALDSLEKSRSFHLDTVNLASSLYYSALAYESIGSTDSMISYFVKIAKLNEQPRLYFPEIKNVYFKLYEHAKNNNQLENQLIYIEKYIETDSMLESNSKGLISRIDRDYDLPLFEERRRELKEIQLTKKRLTYIVVILVFLLISLTIYYLNHLRLQKKRLKFALVSPENYIKSIPRPKPGTQEKKNSIAPDLITQLDLFFNDFEETNAFLDSSTSLQQLAQLANTNTSYLSNYLNLYRGGYTDYINSLRVQYAFSDMAKNPKIVNYTLEYIAKTYGFTSLRVFNRAFEKFIKLKPRDYLSEIKDCIEIKT